MENLGKGVDRLKMKLVGKKYGTQFTITEGGGGGAHVGNAQNSRGCDVHENDRHERDK